MTYKEALTNPVFEIIRDVTDKMALESYVIGGFVRDFLLKRNLPKDIDIVTIGSGINLAEEIAKKLPKSLKCPFLKILVRPK